MFLNELIVVFVPRLFLNLPWLTPNHIWVKLLAETQAEMGRQLE